MESLLTCELHLKLSPNNTAWVFNIKTIDLPCKLTLYSIILNLNQLIHLCWLKIRQHQARIYKKSSVQNHSSFFTYVLNTSTNLFYSVSLYLNFEKKSVLKKNYCSLKAF